MTTFSQTDQDRIRRFLHDVKNARSTSGRLKSQASEILRSSFLEGVRDPSTMELRDLRLEISNTRGERYKALRAELEKRKA